MKFFIFQAILKARKKAEHILEILELGEFKVIVSRIIDVKVKVDI